MRLRKNDTVLMTRGKDRGKKGRVLRVFSGEGMALVEGINRAKKHMRPTRENPKGGIILKENPVRLPSLRLVCPRCSKPAGVGFLFLTDGSKKRICKKCKEIL